MFAFLYCPKCHRN